ncbi:MAG: hypothetical protein PWR20_1841 [Bacteroidales bacterium]|nr:hypothetical protein [Bacteroidales bacterium]MDN5330761.1 hypothetical protein [Bacteroidales bacterium]
MWNIQSYLMEDPTLEKEKEKVYIERPDLLTALCILTFIGSGTGAFVYWTYGLFFNEFQKLFAAGTLTFPGLDIIMSGGPKYFITGAILFSASLAGAILMWRLRAAGFHLYTAAQVLLSLLPVVMIKDYPFPVVDFAITALFILLYRYHLRYMQL